jgi:putative SOS response-associated peptidase YedK
MRSRGQTSARPSSQKLRSTIQRNRRAKHRDSYSIDYRDAYRRRRCILPVDGFFEWKAIKGQKAKQPYAIAMKDRSPFGIGGLWENWKDPTSGEWIRTFAIITTPANELVAEIHDRMPVILAPTDYVRWLSDEPDPGDLMRLSRRSRCGCGRSRRASTSRRTTIRRLSNRSR